MDEERVEETGHDPAEREEKSDREEGGPTRANKPGEEDATGGGHGTRPSQFEPHE